MSVIRSIFVAIALLAASTLPATAVSNSHRVESSLSVEEAIARISEAVEQSGARVFATVDYQAGIKSVGGTLRPTTLIIFGGPGIGASAFQESQTLGLFLPLRILAYEDEAGQVWLMYPDPGAVAPEHGVAANHPAVMKMQSVLKTLSGIAAGGS